MRQRRPLYNGTLPRCEDFGCVRLPFWLQIIPCHHRTPAPTRDRLARISLTHNARFLQIHDRQRQGQRQQPGPTTAVPASLSTSRPTIGRMAESLSAAAAAQPPPAFQTRFACVPLNKQDCIRFISFGADDVASMRNTVQAAWLKGINSVRPYGGADEFKLHGNPWETDGWGNDDARRLVRRMLEGLFDRGWVLQAGVDTSKKVMDKGEFKGVGSGRSNQSLFGQASN